VAIADCGAVDPVDRGGSRRIGRRRSPAATVGRMAELSDSNDPLGDTPSDARSTERPLFGTTTGQKINRVLLLIGLVVMLWVVYVVTKAMS